MTEGIFDEETRRNTILNRALMMPLEEKRVLNNSAQSPAAARNLPTSAVKLQHFAYSCPTLHEAGSRMRVERWSYGCLFGGSTRVVIPLFQRAYCWSPTTTVPAWWRDTVAGGAHSTGKVFLLDVGDDVCVLDGQQRITTSLLLVAAARDALLHRFAGESQCARAIEWLDEILFVDVKAARQWAAAEANGDVREGERLPFARLVPSYADRKSFFEAITDGMRGPRVTSASTRASVQFASKAFFDRAIAMLPSISSVVERVHSALAMQLMLIMPMSASVNAAQVFQWLQEKSLVSMGALLFNPTPGLQLRASDLVRNLVASAQLDRPLAEQEEVLANGWLARIELPCAARGVHIDAALALVCDCEAVPVGETERGVLAAAARPELVRQDLRGLLLYARVLSVWQHEEHAEIAAHSNDDDGDGDGDVSARLRRVAARLVDKIAMCVTRVLQQ